MTRYLPDRLQWVLATGVAVLLLGAVGYGAMPQVKKGTPKPAPPPSGDLQQQVTALAQRTKQLEDYIATLEQARAAGAAVADKVPAQDVPATVKAPFTVVDAKNNVIMRVQDTGASLGRGVYVFKAGEERPMAHVGILADGSSGRVYVATVKATRPEVQMLALKHGGVVEVLALGGDHRFVQLDSQGVSIFNTKDLVIGNMGALNERGALEINDVNGEKMVTAGVLSTGRGVVQANPSHVTMSLDGNPSVLLGGGKK